MASPDRPLRATLRSPWPESSFCLATDGTLDVDVEVTARLPALRGSPNREGKAAVRLEGAHIGRVILGEP